MSNRGIGRANPPQTSRGRRAEAGYILLMLMLFVAILAITAAAVVPSITQQVKRDREEELIHRGVQYSRAIRRYVKKFGRYPARLEELENTNNFRFLRKRYKDPITGQDFRILHLGEVQMFPGAGSLPGVAPIQSVGAPGAGGINGAGAVPELIGAVAAVAGTAAQALNGAGTQTATSGATSASPSDAQNSTNQDTGQGGSGASPQQQAQPNSAGAGSTTPLSAQVFGGGPIVGVASKSKDKSIREFNKKNHYNDWQFIYDPSLDRGGMLNTPAQPLLQGAVQSVNGQPGQAGTGINQSTPFGTSPQTPPQNPPPDQPQQPPPQQQQ